jgi:hypothetical protein
MRGLCGIPGDFGWHGASSAPRMARRRAEHAPVGLTSNGIVIVNVLSLLSEAEAANVRRALPPGLGTDWFLGTAVPANEVADMLSRLDDAAAEAAARFVSRAQKPQPAKPRRKAK